VKRWNGWGSDKIEASLSSSAKAHLVEVIGPAQAGPTADFNDIVLRCPPSRLPDHPLINKDPGLRLGYARGQSLPDWIALRYGTVGLFPDGVARPADEEQVEELISFAQKNHICLIPYGGGTSVVGHINPAKDGQPVLTASLERLRKMIQFTKATGWQSLVPGFPGLIWKLNCGREVIRSAIFHSPLSFRPLAVGSRPAQAASNPSITAELKTCSRAGP